MARTNPLGVRVEIDTKLALEQAAADDDRTVTSLVERILRQWLVDHKYLDADQLRSYKHRRMSSNKGAA